LTSIPCWPRFCGESGLPGCRAAGLPGCRAAGRTGGSWRGPSGRQYRGSGGRAIKGDLIKLAAGVLLAVLLLGWVLRDVDPALLMRELGRASIPGLLLGTFLNLGHNIFRIWRWRALLEPMRPGVPFRPMFAAVLLGYMTSWVVPGRIGELVRPMILSEREGLPLGPCVGTVVADRVLDATTVVVLFALGAWITPLEGAAAEYAPMIRSASVLMALAAAGAVAAMLLLGSLEARLGHWLERRGRLLRWLVRMALSISSGARALRSPRLLVRCAVHSALAWGTIVAATWVIVRSAGVEIGVGPILVILPMLVLGVAVPTPGGAGTYHAAMRAGLIWFGATSAAAVSAGLLAHAIIVVPTVLIGLLLLWTERLSWKELLSGARRFRTLGEEPGDSGPDRVMETLP